MTNDLPWKRIAVGAVLAAEVAILCVIAFWGTASPVDGLVAGRGSTLLQVEGQTGPWGTIVVRKVVAPTRSWVVVQSRGANGQADFVMGYTPVPAGPSDQVPVALDPKLGAVNSVVVSIVADRGRPGVFEFTPAAASGGGGGGMGMGGGGQASASGAPTKTDSPDKPVVVAGRRVALVVDETSRAGVPGTVTRVVRP